MKFLLSLTCFSLPLWAAVDTLEHKLLEELPPLTSSPAMPLKLTPKNSLVSVGLSALIPGLGHMYLGDTATAGGLFGSTCAGIAWSSFAHSDFSMNASLLSLQTTWSYGLYAAYRDTQIHNGANHSYKMPQDSFSDLTLAPFRWSVLKKPQVWGGLLVMLTLATGLSYLMQSSEAHVMPPLATMPTFSPLFAFPVGIGEESLFRGYLQSQIATLTNPWTGIILSSLAFGAAHIANVEYLPVQQRMQYYSVSLPMITAFGVYFGYLTYTNRSLQESVALHTWYDFILFAAASIAAQTAITKSPSFAISIPF